MKKRTIEEYHALDIHEVSGELPPGFAIADYKERPDDVLSTFDDQLKEFGLEVEEYETEGCFFVWRIIKRTDDVTIM